MIETELPVAAGRAAQHCPQLLSRAADPRDPAQEILRLAQRFAQSVTSELAGLCDVRGLKVEPGETRLEQADVAIPGIAVHTVNSFLALGSERLGALVSASTCEINAQFERLLGGDGRVDRTAVRLPASARPFVTRFEQSVLTAMREATDNEDFALAASMGKAAEIAPFPSHEQVWVLEFAITPPQGSGWTVTLMMCRTTLSHVLGAGVASPATGRAIGERGIDQSAIGMMELPLRALLVDTAVPLSRLTQLRPGSVIPVAINRSIPVLIEHAVVAHGTAGEVDDCIALEISHTSLPGHH